MGAWLEAVYRQCVAGGQGTLQVRTPCQRRFGQQAVFEVHRGSTHNDMVIRHAA